MELKIIGFIYTIVCSILYLNRILEKYGIPKSISASVDDLPHRKDFIFRGYVWGLAVSISLIGQDIIFYCATGFLALVSIFIDLHTKWKKIIHTVGAFGGIGLTFVGILLVNPPMGTVVTLPSLVLAAIIARLKVPKYIFWIEIICIINILIGFGLINVI
jgi:hypothetical protein